MTVADSNLSPLPGSCTAAHAIWPALIAGIASTSRARAAMPLEIIVLHHQPTARAGQAIGDGGLAGSGLWVVVALVSRPREWIGNPVS
jgi:hypothetical protein